MGVSWLRHFYPGSNRKKSFIIFFFEVKSTSGKLNQNLNQNNVNITYKSVFKVITVHTWTQNCLHRDLKYTEIHKKYVPKFLCLIHTLGQKLALPRNSALC